MSDEERRFRIRLNALLYAYVRGEEMVKGLPMTQEEIIAELLTLKAALEERKSQDAAKSLPIRSV